MNFCGWSYLWIWEVRHSNVIARTATWRSSADFYCKEPIGLLKLLCFPVSYLKVWEISLLAFLPLVWPCWLSPVTSLFPMCLSIVSRSICSMNLQFVFCCASVPTHENSLLVSSVSQSWGNGFLLVTWCFSVVARGFTMKKRVACKSYCLIY